MFAEELGGNASRRRQEEARARRRQLKQQQQKKAQQPQNIQQPTQVPNPTNEASTATGDSGPVTSSFSALPNGNGTTTASVAVSTNIAGTPVNAAQLSNFATEIPVPSGDKKPSAVANALQQRQLRQQVQHQQKSATTIQSFYRAHKSNVQLLKQQSTQVAQRLKDVSTLRVVLKQQGKTTNYVPPPALSTNLIRQMIFLTKVIPYLKHRSNTPNGDQQPQIEFPVQMIKLRDVVNDSMKLHLLLQVIIIPGLFSTDENLNPFLVWIQTPEGMYRLKSFLRLCLVAATTAKVDGQVLGSIAKFLRGILLLNHSMTSSNKIHAAVVNACRPLLLSPSPPSLTPSMKSRMSSASTSTTSNKATARKIQSQQHVWGDVKMDIIQILRFHLLYSTGGPDPIPPEADRCREACIPPNQRAQADVLVQLVLDVILGASSLSERQNLYLRFVSEILTVPLLTWKISESSTSKLLALETPATTSPSSPSQQPPPIVLIAMIQNFLHCHGATVLTDGKIESVLAADTPLTSCPATPTQSLLANLILIGRTTPILNGSDARTLDYDATACFFQFIATLVDAVPLGTFSSRESVVEWISDGKGHHSPVVLSSVVMEQCKMLLVDAFVRKLLHCAIDDETLKTEVILLQKNEKDLKQEKELQDAGQASAANLAAQEARKDRNRGFWNSSGWARKLGKGVTKILSGDKPGATGPTPAQPKSGGKLINTSSVSRTLAESGNKKASDNSSKKSLDASLKDNHITRQSYKPELLIALVRVYGIILARWGGGGKEDIVKRVRDGQLMKRDENGANQEVATSKADPCTQALLNVLCFSTPILRTLWGMIQSDPDIISDLYTVIDSSKGKAPVRSLTIRPQYSMATSPAGNRLKYDGAAFLYVFVCALVHVLIVTDDTEIHDMERPIPQHQLRRCIQILKQLLYRASCVDDASHSDSASTGGNDGKRASQDSNYFGLALISASSRAMRDLYDRSSRKPLCVPKLWLVEDLMEREIRACKTHGQYVALLDAPVLRVCPFLVSFKRRLKIFERIVTTNRVEIQGENSPNPFHTNPLKPGIPVRITRGRILEDGLATMNKLGVGMRQRISVQYHNEAGAREDGVDAGGLFKEFWTDLCAIAFDPNYALFRVTEGAGNCMYPSPSSGAAHGSDHIVLFEFLGRILGKALYEGITIRPQFAHFFLSFLRGDYNYFHMLPDLSTMDPQLYNNLMFLKNYDGDAEDLCLTFTVANDDFGGNKEIPLIPNGANIPVTDSNKQRYIGLVAKHHVVDRVKEQSEAFTRGLWEVIDRQWLLLFNEPELQVLISGAADGKIDVDDMRSNTRYLGGYTGIDPNVNRFWRVVGSMESKHQQALLRFVTSCERPPPLGFATMNPPFTIQRVGILRDGDKLPTASTCFNILKLPTYSSEKVLRDRLIYAIEAGAGFELT